MVAPKTPLLWWPIGSQVRLVSQAAAAGENHSQLLPFEHLHLELSGMPTPAYQALVLPMRDPPSPHNVCQARHPFSFPTRSGQARVDVQSPHLGSCPSNQVAPQSSAAV